MFVSIYDIFGKQVKNFHLVKNSEGARKGWNVINWDCLDKNNNLIQSGVYICKIHIANKKNIFKTEKFVVVK